MSSGSRAYADRDPVEAAMSALRKAERTRRRAITRLKDLDVIRSRTLVGDLGEQLVADFYGVDLEPPSTPGFDLRRKDGCRVQVRTLQDATYRRTTIGAPKEPYDLLFALRLDEDFYPIEALEVPRAVIMKRFGGRRVTWTRGLENDPATKKISGDVLLKRQAARRRRRRRTKYQDDVVRR